MFLRFSRLAFLLCPAALTVGCVEPAAPRVDSAPRVPNVPTASPESPAIKRANSGRIYVPTYSHIYTSSGAAKDLAATLSIRNMSLEHELVVDSVRYYDTAGRLIQEHVSGKAVKLGPLETVEYFVPTQDRRGGSGANFLVTWHSRVPLIRPLVEAVMVRDDQGTRSFAFSSRGVDVPNLAKPPNEASPAPPIPDAGPR